MPRTVTTQEATIEIMQVEIQVLKVGKKQVTMGMFRQLPHEPLLEGEEVHLRGVPWGHVCYWWEGDGSQSEGGPRLHVVWQLGAVLYRSVIAPQPPRGTRRFFRDAIQSVMDRLFLRLAGQAGEMRILNHINGVLTVEWQHFSWSVDLDGDLRFAYELLIQGNAAADFLARGVACQQGWHSVYAENTEKYLKVLEKWDLHEVTEADLVAQRQALMDRQKAYEQRWGRQWQTLSALPQLFIAV